MMTRTVIEGSGRTSHPFDASRDLRTGLLAGRQPSKAGEPLKQAESREIVEG